MKIKYIGEVTLFSKRVAVVWILYISSILGFYGFINATKNNTFGWFGGMPSLDILENPRSELASELYSADGVLLGKYFRNNRTPVEHDEISDNLFNALKATEDIRFEKHAGIDGRALMRVFWGVITLNPKGGGSTITQQLAKNLFKMRDDSTYIGAFYKNKILRTLTIKTKEWIIATQLEKSYTKDEIITMYLNTVDFGSNAFGIKVASKTFFNKEPKDIKPEEAAVMIGLLKAITAFNPVLNPDRSLDRRNVVLNQMYKYDFLSKNKYDSLRATPITLDYNVENHNQGPAPYFRNIVRNKVVRWCKENGYDLFSDGLKIYTTLDSRMQTYAENALTKHIKTLQHFFDIYWKGKNPWVDENGKELPGFIENAIKRTDRYKQLKETYESNNDSINYHLNKPRKMKIFTWQGEKDTVMSSMDSLRYYKRFLHGGLMAMDPHTGEVKAWAGGFNYQYFNYDHVIQGARQPGSTFKPFLYLAALDNGYSPCDTVKDTRYTFITEDVDGYWSPQNYTMEYSEKYLTLREGLAQSLNSIAAYLMTKIGPKKVVEYAKRLGITTPLDSVYALALGVSDVKLYDMVGAYATFANKGIWTEPLFITRIEDKNGNVLQTFTANTKDAISEEYAYLMLHMLQGATDWKYKTLGTAIRLRTREYEKFGGEEYYFTGEIAAKTGTTNNYSDGWFMGILPDLVTGIWVGADDRGVHFRQGEFGQGSRMAMPIFGNFLKQVYTDTALGIAPKQFEKPVSRLPVEIDCGKYYNQKFETDSLGNIIDNPYIRDIRNQRDDEE